MSLKPLLQKFLDRVEEQLSSNDDPLGSEFLELRDLSRRLNQTEGYETAAGATEENMRKNRYKDIRPFDYTRVSLCPTPGVPGSDYVNANFIQGYNGKAAYIASQGPMPHTVDDFWAMLWQYNVQVVVMACNEREAGKAKCERYWAYSDEEKSFRGISVKFIKEEMICEDFLIRHLAVSDANEERTIQQFHYVNWPDHGAPETCTSLLEMVAMIREVQPGDQPPIVIHCSAGCGRTGTICAVDYAWSVLKSGGLTAEFNVYNIIVEMRKQRPSVVQSKDQYILVHQAIAELFEQHLEMIKDHLYMNVMIEGAGRPMIEDDIYEDVGALNLPKNDDGEEEDVYVNAHELPKKRLSSHAAEKTIMETVAKMATDEDDETPDKFYSVARSLSKFNAAKPTVKKNTQEDKVHVRGVPTPPGKKPPPIKRERSSDPVPNSEKPEKERSERKISLSSLQKNSKSMDQGEKSPILTTRKSLHGRKRESEDRLPPMPEVGKIGKLQLNLGELMFNSMVGKKADSSDKSSLAKPEEGHKGNVDELRQKLEHTGVPLIGVSIMPDSSTHMRTGSNEKLGAHKPEIPSQKPEKPSHKPEKPTIKPEKPLQKHEKPNSKPDVPKLLVVKELLQRKKSAGVENVDVKSKPEPTPRHSLSDSDPPSETPKEEKRNPLPLPRGHKNAHAKKEESDNKESSPSESSDYSEAYEFVKEVRDNLRAPDSGKIGPSKVPASASASQNNTYELEKPVTDATDGGQPERRTVPLPGWISDDDPYIYVGQVTGIAASLHQTQKWDPNGNFDLESNVPDDLDLVVIRRTKLLPEWLDDEDPYAVLGGKPQISDSVGQEKRSETPPESNTDVYAKEEEPVLSKPSSAQPTNGAFATWPSHNSDNADGRPPVPIKNFGEDIIPTKPLPEVPDSGSGKDTRGKFKLTLTSIKNKFQTGSSKSSELSSLDNISIKGDDSRYVPKPYLLAFSNRIDKPKGGRPPPWSQ